MKRIILSVACIFIATSFLTGCGTMVTSNLQRMTATKLNKPIDSITIKNVDLGVTVKRWVAGDIDSGEEYDCIADMNFENTNCILLKSVAQKPENGKRTKKRRPPHK